MLYVLKKLKISIETVFLFSFANINISHFKYIACAKIVYFAVVTILVVKKGKKIMRILFICSIASLCIICLCTQRVIEAPTAVTVVINEFMTSNTQYLDENNEADDWIELYNKGKSPASLKGLFLSDDSTELDKFALPDTVLPVHGFVVVWADNDESQGSLHAPFKLSSQNDGEIILTQDKKIIIDRIQFLPSALGQDESYGRWSDGAPTWAQQQHPTPGSANSGGMQ